MNPMTTAKYKRAYDALRVIKRPTKQHRCVWCDGFIIIGETHSQYVGKFEGEFQDWRIHQDCIVPMEKSPAYEWEGEICSGPHARGGSCEC